MRPITLTDLDGVHFQTRRGCPINLELTVAALGSNMTPSSFATPKQVAFLQWLLKESEVVPVTARTVESFQRVVTSFSGFAICSFGGVILTPNGVPEPRWHEQIKFESSVYASVLKTLKEVIEQACLDRRISLSVTIVSDAGCDLYLNCKLSDGEVADASAPHDPADVLLQARDLVASLLPEYWTLHCNGNNIAALPPFLGKERAAYFYLSELAPPASCVLGIGDSLTDLKFMKLCDYAVTPKNSQVFEFLDRL